MPARPEADGKGFVGVLSVELFFPGAASLKDKRMYLRRLRDRLVARHSVSFAEIAYQDLWQRTKVLVAFAASDARQLDGVMEAVIGYLHSQDWEVLHMEEEVIEVDA